jgi:N utilization substance protein A
MTYQIEDALRDIIKEKGIDKEFLVEALEAGLLAGLKRKFGVADNAVIEIDPRNWNIEVYLIKVVAKRRTNRVTQLSVKEAKAIDPEAEVGTEFKIPLHLEEFGRNAIIVAKQTIVQKVREAEREKIFATFKGRVGDIVTGSIQKVDRNGVFINLGRAEALLPPKEQIKTERYRQGNPIRVYILDVRQSPKTGPQIILSRSHPDFLKKLLQFEVPEVYEGIVEVRSVAREAGERTKIAVYSKDNKIDPVGACVGVRGSRIQAIVRELSGEKIDVVQWSSDRIVFVTRALSPAKPSNILITDEEEQSILAVIPDDQFSLAIGRGGQNARLASKLTGWKIDIVKEGEYREKVEKERKSKVMIAELKDLSAQLRQKLAENGYETAFDLDQVSEKDLMEIPGIGRQKAKKVKKVVADSYLKSETF